MTVSHGSISHDSGIAAPCRLCRKLSASDQREIWNQPVLESPNFVVVPSLGALVEGWLLIVPKEHFLSAAVLPQHLLTELSCLKELVCDAVQEQYGSVCVFEHGPAREHRPTGCGVDHAHIHVVPICFDLPSSASRLLPQGVDWRPATREECRFAVKNLLDYLYIEQPVGNARFAAHSEFSSQFFRRVIAEQLGIPDQYRWHDHPQINNVVATVMKFRSLERSREALVGPAEGSNILDSSSGGGV